jgi:hypothetical protein
VLAGLVIVVLGAHLLLVDLAMAAPLACVWLEWRATRQGDDAAGQAGLALARAAAWALTGGILLGVVLLAVRWWQDDRYLTAVLNIPRSRLWFAAAEIVFFFACMGAYVALWDRWRGWRLAHRALAVAGATNLLVHFPALFVIISLVDTRADLLAAPLDAAQYRRLLVDPEVLSRIVHIWMSALAVTGVVVMGLALRQSATSRSGEAAAPLLRLGAVWALVPTFLQIPVGLWVIMEMPPAAREPLLGSDLLATGLFATSVLLALWLMHSLSAIALGNKRPAEVRRAVSAMLFLVVLMAGTRLRAPARPSAAPEDVQHVAAWHLLNTQSLRHSP